MTPYLEHANLTVRDLDGAVEFLRTAIPEFEVRGRGEGDDRRWLHLGTATSYVALEAPHEPGERMQRPYRDPGINHLGFVVEDAAAVRLRLLEAGYTEGIQAGPHPHRVRIYFYDRDGIEYEFVQYLSGDDAERNDYSR